MNDAASYSNGTWCGRGKAGRQRCHPLLPSQRLHPRRAGAIRIKCGVQPCKSTRLSEPRRHSNLFAGGALPASLELIMVLFIQPQVFYSCVWPYLCMPLKKEALDKETQTSPICISLRRILCCKQSKSQYFGKNTLLKMSGLGNLSV